MKKSRFFTIALAAALVLCLVPAAGSAAEHSSEPGNFLYHPQDCELPQGGKVSLYANFSDSFIHSLQAQGATLTYQWQWENGTDFTDLADSDTISGAGTANLTLSALPDAAVEEAAFRMRIHASHNDTYYYSGTARVKAVAALTERTILRDVYIDIFALPYDGSELCKNSGVWRSSVEVALCEILYKKNGQLVYDPLSVGDEIQMGFVFRTTPPNVVDTKPTNQFGYFNYGQLLINLSGYENLDPYTQILWMDYTVPKETTITRIDIDNFHYPQDGDYFEDSAYSYEAFDKKARLMEIQKDGEKFDGPYRTGDKLTLRFTAGAGRLFGVSETCTLWINGTQVGRNTAKGFLVMLPYTVPAPGEEGIIGEEKPYTFPFTDVKTTDWFWNDVQSAHKSGLINGKTDTLYGPGDNMTYAEAVKLAACMNQLYYDGEVTLKSKGAMWYSSYMDYCLEKGIITMNYSAYADVPISRSNFVHIFYQALPAGQYEQINKVVDWGIRDVNPTTEVGKKIYTFYRAGILTGNGASGVFNPESNITRAEVAAIMTRMFDPAARKSVTLLGFTPDA